MSDDGWNSDPEPPGVTVVNEHNNHNRNHNGGAYRGRGRGRGNQTFVNSNWRDRNQTHSGNEQSIMEVKSSMVGRIIGRGGSKIRDLEFETSAKIIISKSQESSDLALSRVILRGTKDAQERARQLIEELMVDDRRHNKYQKPQEESVTSEYVNTAGSSRGVQELEHDENSDEPINWSQLYEENLRRQEEYWATLPVIVKDLYVEDPEVAGMSQEAAAAWRLANNNTTVDCIYEDTTKPEPKIPNPVDTFEQGFAAYPEILEEIRKQNFTRPSPIQGQAWPVLMSGNDLIGIAQTGTGKTLAFLLPALIHIDRQPLPIHEREGPNVLVLAPTRELALQIEKEVSKYHYRGIKSVCIYGGGNRSEQVKAVGKGVQIIIATPGRLNDLVKSKKINLETITYLVLDEADRMLDMGFEPQIRVSLLYIRSGRQTVMTSATWPSQVQRLAHGMMKNPIRVVVGSLELAAVHSVSQKIIFVGENTDEKFPTLLDFLTEMVPSDKVIVFCSRRATATNVASEVVLRGVKCQSIYGGLEQSDREQALEDMRTGEVNILIATDIASRGIDIEDVTHIVNFDFPNSLEEFVHRVGRTGRAGKTGKAITYMSRRDWDKAAGLIDILEEANQEVPQELFNMKERYTKKQETDRRNGGGNFRRGRGGGFRRNNEY